MLDNKYKRWYFNLIAKANNREIKIDSYYETHHIIPKCIGGTNEKNNLIKLYPREHFIAHLLLTKIYKNEEGKKLLYASYLMSNCPKTKFKVNSKIYCSLKLKFSQMISEKKTGIPRSQNTKDKISNALLGKFYPRSPMSVAAKEKIAEINRNRLLNKKQSVDLIEKRRRSIKEFYKHNESYHKGKTRTEEFKKHLSKLLTGKKRGPMSDTHRQRVSAGRSGIVANHPNYKKVICGNVLIFNSVRQCGEFLNIGITKLHKHLKGYNKNSNVELTNLGVRYL